MASVKINGNSMQNDFSELIILQTNNSENDFVLRR